MDAYGVAYFWDLSDLRLLEPNRSVAVEAHGEWGARLLRELEAVQRSSWGFFVPPRLGLHVVLVARLGSEAVGSAYLNRLNANVDYGAHVVRRLRRSRVGTRLLHEAASIARGLGHGVMSVVRVFRRVAGTAADGRAVAFYLANCPTWRFGVLRLRRGSGACRTRGASAP